jgi:vesicular inhibitory amino acid transporter
MKLYLTLYYSALGAITTIIVVIIITVQGIVDTSQPIPATHKIIDYSGIPIALASICFSFGGAVVFPYVECTMKEPRKFPLVLTLAMTSIGALYLMISVVGYWKYGDGLKSPIFDNLQENAPTLAARILITAHVYLACPVYLCTFGSNVERSLKINRISNKLAAFSLRAIFRGLTVAALSIIAIFLPHFNSIMSLIGSICDCSLLFIIPILCHLKLKGIRGRPWYDYIMIAIMSVAAVVCLIWGTIDAIEGLIKDFKN